MKKLLELIEVARRQGSIPAPNDSDSGAGFDRQSYSLDHLDRWIEQGIKPLVFTPDSDSVSAKNAPDPVVNTKGLPIIDNAPFPLFSLEYAGSLNISFNETVEYAHEVPCIVAIENPIDPCSFVFLIHAKAGNFLKRYEKVMLMPQGYEGIVQQMLTRFYGEQVGTIAGRQRIKRLSPGKGKHTIREVIFISPRRQSIYTNEGSGKTIDYSHRFAVRGHWRRVSGIGKDRQGNYCIQGYTWVVDSIKGPEDKPLINKTRVITKETK